MHPYATTVVTRLSAGFRERADVGRAAAMASYMRGQFAFFGVPSPERRVATREALAGLGVPSETDLMELAAALWALPEREYQYAGCDILGRYITVCGPGFLDVARELIASREDGRGLGAPGRSLRVAALTGAPNLPWWDTVDAVATGVVGPLVLRYPELVAVMDECVESEDFWLVRTAILHQLRYKRRTDARRLFAYCELSAGASEFFVRKAIGWALREYSKTDAAAVRAFVAAQEGKLSGLTKREALLWLNGGRTKAGGRE
ncbi:MAG: DNA alkylation repair protein [Chloroflexi bacterium]|nr:DNA alkylation repair protein [Chloroflexota bacterium]